MNSSVYRIIFALVMFVFVGLPQITRAQNGVGVNKVDTAAIKKRIDNEYLRRDSMLAAAKQRRIDDSIARVLQKQKIQDYRDSLVNARKAKRVADSIARVEAKLKLDNDKRIKDSTDLAIRTKTKDSLVRVAFIQDSIRSEQKRLIDSIALANKQIQDSVAFAKKAYADSVKLARIEEQRKKAELTKYQNSKYYKDSVEARKLAMKDSLKNARQSEMDLVKAERQRVNDSIKNTRLAYNDSLTAARKKYNDSLSTAQKNAIEKNREQRQRINDSLLTERQKRKDSLDVVRKKNEKDIVKGKEKTSAEKQKALAMKVHQKKKEEWTNEKLLKKKWNMPRRIYQNTVTRYNYYYNAKRKYDEAIRSMTRNYKEDFAKPINLDPYDIKKQGGSVSSFMDTVIKKSSFSTQIHDPRSKWFDNLYFLMGRASFAKNDFDGAITTFQFIANEYKETPKKSADKATKAAADQSIATLENRKGIRKLRHHPIRNDALLWLAKSYVMAEQYSEAQSLLGALAKDKNFPNRKKADLFLAKASLDLEQGNKTDAIASLNSALKQDMPSKTKHRMEYLLGQLYAENKEYAKSTEHFKNSLSKKTSPEMDFMTKLSIAENAAKGGGDKAYALAQLEKIINDPKYANYKSQALNTLASIEKLDNSEAAINHLRKSISNPENKDIKQKAIAFAELGEIYYSLSNYEAAKVAYDSASYHGTNPPIDNLNEVNTRKVILGDIVNYIRIIRTQDSMLLLTKKSDKEQKAAAKRELDKLKKDKELTNASNGSTQVIALQPNNAIKSNWYFYSSALVLKGTTDFKQKWGNRKLEDNWRRMAATNSNFMTGDSQGDESEEEEGDSKESVGGVTVQSLLSKLPKTPAEIDLANTKIQDAYYNLGLTYFSQLQDYLHSIDMFDTLVYRFPTTTFKKQSYYGLYINYDKLDNHPKATFYKKLLNDEFGQSDFALRANNPNYAQEQKKGLSSILEHYDSTYASYKLGEFQHAIDRTTFAYNTYKSSPVIAKYKLVEAISYAGLKNFEQSKTILQSVIQSYPNSEEQKRAQEIINFLNTSKPIDGDTTQPAPGLELNAFNAGNTKYLDSLEAGEAFKELRAADGKGMYDYVPSESHKVMIFVKNVDGRTMALKSALSDYNLLKHNVKEYITGMNLLTPKQAIITIEQFSNSVFAKQYAIEMANEKLLFSQLKKNEFEIAIISNSNVIELTKSRDVLNYLRFYKKNYK